MIRRTGREEEEIAMSIYDKYNKAVEALTLISSQEFPNSEKYNNFTNELSKRYLSVVLLASQTLGTLGEEDGGKETPSS
jgi:hypothetical protein